VLSTVFTTFGSQVAGTTTALRPASGYASAEETRTRRMAKDFISMWQERKESKDKGKGREHEDLDRVERGGKTGLRLGDQNGEPGRRAPCLYRHGRPSVPPAPCVLPVTSTAVLSQNRLFDGWAETEHDASCRGCRRCQSPVAVNTAGSLHFPREHDDDSRHSRRAFDRVSFEAASCNLSRNGPRPGDRGSHMKDA
jgi:hypothetical protein